MVEAIRSGDAVTVDLVRPVGQRAGQAAGARPGPGDDDQRRLGQGQRADVPHGRPGRARRVDWAFNAWGGLRAVCTSRGTPTTSSAPRSPSSSGRRTGRATSSSRAARSTSTARAPCSRPRSACSTPTATRPHPRGDRGGARRPPRRGPGDLAPPGRRRRRDGRPRRQLRAVHGARRGRPDLDRRHRGPAVRPQCRRSENPRVGDGCPRPAPRGRKLHQPGPLYATDAEADGLDLVAGSQSAARR